MSIEHTYYLLALLIAIGGLVASDFRWKLAFFYDPLRTLKALAPTLLFFIVWDAAGIGSNIFLYGGSRYSLGLLLAPEFPIEELFFLFLLTYTALLIYRISKKCIRI